MALACPMESSAEERVLWSCPRGGTGPRKVHHWSITAPEGACGMDRNLPAICFQILRVRSQ